MNLLRSRAFARRVAFPLLAVVVGSLFAPTPTMAAAQPEQQAGVAAAVAPTLTDLGSTNMGLDSFRYAGGINTHGQVAAQIADTLNSNRRAVLLAPGRPAQRFHESLGLGGDGYSYALDVNDRGDVVGGYGSGKPFVVHGGAVTKPNLQGAAVAINNVGQVLGGDWVYDPLSAETLKLAPAGVSVATMASSLNVYGQVVGVIDADPDPKVTRSTAFRTRADEPVNLKRDLLRYTGDTHAYDINNSGQVAGYGRDLDGVGYVPLIWGEDGQPLRMNTPLGGQVLAINEAGLGAGWMWHKASSDASAHQRAALYANGQGVDLNTLLPENTSFTLTQATGINDRGQIAGLMLNNASRLFHVFVLDLKIARPKIESMTLETRLYPSEAWVPVPESGTVDGNEVRVTVTITNPSNYPERVSCVLQEEVFEGSLPNCGRNLTLAPHETVTKRVVWDTTGFAWHEGKGWSDRSLTAELRVSHTPTSLDVSLGAPITIRPKPVVLVHGYRSNRETAWDGYTSVLASVHPLLNGYPVDTLNTGDPKDPSKPTFTIERNAGELGDYIDGVREVEGAFQVDVVAHDSGGVIARHYIQAEMPSKPAVSRMLQMGTPNRGTPCADMLLAGTIGMGGSPPAMPATKHSTVAYMDGVFNKNVTNIKGVKVSSLVGVGHGVSCLDPEGGVAGDGMVPKSSARYVYTDTPVTRTRHDAMTHSAADFLSYVQPRLASVLAGADNPDGAQFAPGKGVAPASGQEDVAVTSGEASPADGDGGAATGGASAFVALSSVVEPGQTVSVPVEVPQGTAFGVTGALPSTVGLVLRDPAGKPAAQYAAGSDEAKQPIQGLSVAKPQAGAWKLEITNSAAEAVKADLVAWVAGNAVTVAATAEQSADDGRVAVRSTVTDGSEPVTGVPVRAILLGTDGTRHELPLSDDGGSGDGAADDGVYGATSEPLADGVYSVTVKADTAKGVRAALDVVEVKRPDTREFELALSAQPGGSVSASPAQDVYRVGSAVTLTAAPEAGRVPIGWTVDGQERPAGKLTLVMDGPHTVVARFGSYTVTELDGTGGEDAGRTHAVAVNDRGQVAATVVEDNGKHRAVRWQAGESADLGGLPCTESSTGPHEDCDADATGINEAGDVSGYAITSAESGNVQRAVLFGRDGSVTDLQKSGTGGFAFDVNDNGQVFGAVDGRYVMWDRGTAVGLPATPPFHKHGSTFGGIAGDVGTRINAQGAVAGAYVTDRGVDGTPTSWSPAVYQDGVTAKLAIPADCPNKGGGVYAVNTTGVAVGELKCPIHGSSNAYMWRDGKPVDLGVGKASAVNEHGLVVGLALDPDASTPVKEIYEPVIWLEDKKYPLADLLPRPLCPKEPADTRMPCMGLNWLHDVNSSGQIVAQGFIRDRSSADGSSDFVTSPRSFLLTPTTAQADLEVTAAVSATEPGPGAKVTWTATVTNTGEDTATDVRLDVFTPPGVTGAACDTWRGRCTEIQGGFRNTVKVLEKGWSATVEVSATIPADTADGAEFKTHAMADSLAVSDPKIENNGAEVTSTVRPLLNTVGVNWADAVQVGQVSHPYTVTLTNRLNGPIPLRVIAASGPFTQSNACPVELAVGKACTVQVRFAPTAEGPANGALTFTTAEGAEAAFTVPLTGQGAKAGGTPVPQVPAAPLRGQVGKPFTLKVSFTDADTADTHTAQVAWGDGPPVPAEVTRQPGGGTVEVTRTFTAPRTGTALVMVTDSGGALGTAGVPYVIEEAAANTAPVLDVGGDVELSAGEKLQRVVTFTDPGSSSWSARVDYGDGAGPRPVIPDEARQITLEHQWATPGRYPVTVTVKDDGGLETAAAFTATVLSADTPNQAPAVTLETHFDTVEAGSGWVGMGSFVDPDSSSWTYSADYGDGAGSRPLALTAGQLKLQHVYPSAGDHTVVLAVTDDKGATGTARLTVHVTNAAPEVALTQPVTAVAVGTEVRLNASFTDPGGADVHTAVWTIGGTPVPAAVAESTGPAKSTAKNAGTVTGSHVFTKAGRYPISVTVTDDKGATGTDTIDGQTAYVLVYDPAGSLVGAGQMLSPAGACTLAGQCAKEGKATLEVTARYRGKDTTPAGELRYNAPGFDLRDGSHTVLAASGGTAILRGTGKVNKSVDVTYEITAVDSGKPADRTDRLLVRVWKKNGELIYDNSASPSPVSGVIRVSG
ncbi:PKD domain-containing protein [Streptosporangium sp. NPDC049644]|uniref:PKD domain-containing protein n=1 Tax=Streptosporangium sp. NPDC049644 TaxID=3155507 RepID=UPI003421CC38